MSFDFDYECLPRLCGGMQLLTGVTRRIPREAFSKILLSD